MNCISFRELQGLVKSEIETEHSALFSISPKSKLLSILKNYFCALSRSIVFPDDIAYFKGQLERLLEEAIEKRINTLIAANGHSSIKVELSRLPNITLEIKPLDSVNYMYRFYYFGTVHASDWANAKAENGWKSSQIVAKKAYQLLIDTFGGFEDDD